MNIFAETHNLTDSEYCRLEQAVCDASMAQNISMNDMWANVAILLDDGKLVEDVILELELAR